MGSSNLRTVSLEHSVFAVRTANERCETMQVSKRIRLACTVLLCAAGIAAVVYAFCPAQRLLRAGRTLYGALNEFDFSGIAVSESGDSLLLYRHAENAEASESEPAAQITAPDRLVAAVRRFENVRKFQGGIFCATEISENGVWAGLCLHPTRVIPDRYIEKEVAEGVYRLSGVSQSIMDAADAAFAELLQNGQTTYIINTSPADESAQNSIMGEDGISMNTNALPHSIDSGVWDAGHCQGIAVDPENGYVYYSFTTMLLKTDLQGNVIGTVTGLLGHLGCIDFCDGDGRVYGSLEYKNDVIGKGILQRLGVETKIEDAFYIAIFDVSKIDRVGMDATSDGVMTTVYLKEVVDDYHAEVVNNSKTVAHRYGCSGIDGTTFAPFPGSDDEKQYLFVSYGVYSDTERTDNDYQVILCYDTADWAQYEKPLLQEDMHTSGPESPRNKLFAYTGNTNYGVQNLEYDAYTKSFLMAVYVGKKKEFPNHPMYIIDARIAPRTETLKGVEPETTGEVLTLLHATEPFETPGYDFPLGSTGLYAFGDGKYYVSDHGRNDNGYYTQLRLCHWDGISPIVADE